MKLDFIKNKEDIENSAVSVFNLIERPEKPVADYTDEELQTEGKRIAAVYLMRKGYEVLGVDLLGYDVVAKEDDNTLVLLDVTTALDLEDENGIPIMDTSQSRIKKSKKKIFKALGEYDKDVEVGRCDFIAIDLKKQDKASLRHLVNVFYVDIDARAIVEED